MASSKPVKVDKKELLRAEEFWSNFMIATKYAILSTTALLVLLALAFVKFT